MIFSHHKSYLVRNNALTVTAMFGTQCNDVVLLCETKVYSNSAIRIRGFQSFPAIMQKNCVEVFTLVSDMGYVI